MSGSLQSSIVVRRESGARHWWLSIFVVLAVLVTLFAVETASAQDASEASSSTPDTPKDETPAVKADGTPAADADAAKKNELPAFATWIDAGAKAVVDEIYPILFWDPVKAFWSGRPADFPKVPFVLIWLVFGGTVFTFWMGFINLRGFGHGLQLVRGKYSDPNSPGEVTHFQALSAALSATVGLGNIGGVAIAVNLGGPGAVFWMMMCALIGMSSKFVECTLGQKYREIDSEGRVSGGAMHYLSRGLAELGMKPLGMALAIIFSVLCIGASFGGGNMFQSNQSFEAVKQAFGFESAGIASYVYGVVVAAMVGLVIIGGIKRIATTASRIVPAMCGLYLLVSLYILLTNFTAIPSAFMEIFTQAFNPDTDAVKGGIIGAIVVGVQRAAFSNEAGIGSAPIAHAAAKTDIPIREGLVALLEPFIDTIVVCTMTALVVIITGTYKVEGSEAVGAAITIEAWRTGADWFKYVLCAAVVLFAFSTLISWSYYGERCWAFLFGPNFTVVYKILFIVFIFVGAVINLKNVLDFSDMMLFGMAIPNLLGCLLLSGKVRKDLKSYLIRLKAGEFKRHE